MKNEDFRGKIQRTSSYLCLNPATIVLVLRGILVFIRNMFNSGTLNGNIYTLFPLFIVQNFSYIMAFDSLIGIHIF